MAQAQRQHQVGAAATLNPVPTAATAALHPTPAQEAPDDERVSVPSPSSTSSSSFLAAGEMGGDAAVLPTPQPDPVIGHLDDSNSSSSSNNDNTYPNLPWVSALQDTRALGQPSRAGVVAATAVDGRDSTLGGLPYFPAGVAVEGPTSFPGARERSVFTNGFTGAFSNPFSRGMTNREATAPAAPAFAYPPTPAPPIPAMFGPPPMMGAWNALSNGIALPPLATTEGNLWHGSRTRAESSFPYPSHASMSSVLELEPADGYRRHWMMSEVSFVPPRVESDETSRSLLAGLACLCANPSSVPRCPDVANRAFHLLTAVDCWWHLTPLSFGLSAVDSRVSRSPVSSLAWLVRRLTSVLHGTPIPCSEESIVVAYDLYRESPWDVVWCPPVVSASDHRLVSTNPSKHQPEARHVLLLLGLSRVLRWDEVATLEQSWL